MNRAEASLLSHPEVRRLIEDFAEMNNAREAKAAKADPVAHKLTRVFEGGLHYRYFETRNARGQVVRFAWSTTRNVAGYFLTWREVWTKSGNGSRDQWSASKSRTAAKNRAIDRYNAHNARAAGERG